jgi:hypothetical protein
MNARTAIAIAQSRAFDIGGSHDARSRAALAYCRKALGENWAPAWKEAFAAAIEILSSLTD